MSIDINRDIRECFGENCSVRDIIEPLLKDRTTGENIIWATDEYYAKSPMTNTPNMPMHIEYVVDVKKDSLSIEPRVAKKREVQQKRTHDKAEIFTPAWICNAQNNLIDDAWFGWHAKRFNREKGTTWKSTYMRIRNGRPIELIHFTPPKTKGENTVPPKTWEDYVNSPRLEITCGEAPYLTSRYDAVTGRPISPKNRIGLLDRKLRVISENTKYDEIWLYYAEKALKSIYGYEFQGDSLLLARLNVLLAVAEAFKVYRGGRLPREWIDKYTDIITWNLWQMDGLKGVVPFILKEVIKEDEWDLNESGELHRKIVKAPLKAKIMDWNNNKSIEFTECMRGEQSGK